MPDKIKLLSDSVANQIAAGEVIQRPASVVKELVENAIDAGANSIQVIIKDSGKTLIQIIDNGSGMSETDARMAFERHATSKITKADDLFALTSMGFRGEALASIAAVAEVELRTKLHNNEIGTKINIAGSEIKNQENISCPNGTNFIIKNLFFNIPARRKFLKTNRIEYKHILTELHRIILTNPEIGFSFISDDDTIFQLKPENLRQRIVSVFGKNINQSMISINTETSIVEIHGYITKPERAKKVHSEQFFFANNRYMNHAYFRKAISMAYEKLIKEGEYPSYFIYFKVNPANIDINIHPTKTEIKFEDEHAIFQILNASVKESLGKFNIIPSLDFEDNFTRDMHLTSDTVIKPPTININPNYNPFKPQSTYNNQTNKPPKDWQQVYQTNTNKTPDDFFIPEENNTIEKNNIFDNNDIEIENKNIFFQLKTKYILTSGKSGLIIINQNRAHQRILFEKYMSILETRKGVTQRSLFPIEIEPSSEERAVLIEILTELNNIGFEILLKGQNKFEIKGVPADLLNHDIKEILQNLINVLSEVSGNANMVLYEKIAHSLAKAAAIKTGKLLHEKEMQDIFFRLMTCSNQNYTIEGKKILEIISINEIEKKLN